jgi:hypothetical protein
VDNVLKIVIEDEAPTPAGPGGNRPPPAAPPAQPIGPPPTSPAPAASPSFPSTVQGPDGKSYSVEAYESFLGKPKEPPPIPEFKVKGENALSGEARAGFQKGGRASAEGIGEALKAKEVGGAAMGGEVGALASQAIKGAGSLASGALAAIGPAGLAAGAAIGVLAASAEAATDALHKMKRGVEIVTKVAEASIANNYPSPTEAWNAWRQELSATVKETPIVGEMLGAAMDLNIAITELPDKLTKAFLQQAKAIAPYSGEISAAEARAEVRSIQADIREANELGEEMGRMVDAQSGFEDTFREALLPIKKFLIEVLAERLELIATVADIVLKLPEILRTIASDAVDALAIVFSTESNDGAEKIIKDLPDKLDKIINKDKKKEDNDMFDMFFGAARAQQFGHVGGLPPLPDHQILAGRQL